MLGDVSFRSVTDIELDARALPASLFSEAGRDAVGAVSAGRRDRATRKHARMIAGRRSTQRSSDIAAKILLIGDSGTCESQPLAATLNWDG